MTGTYIPGVAPTRRPTHRPTTVIQAAATDQAPWDGSQTRQASWLNQKRKEAEADFDFKQLCVSNTVTLSKSATIAVLSPKHALEHADGQNKGTMRAPSMRARKELLARSLAKSD
mgnify:CR=1 FL=1